jgi:hypothetical protein
MVAAAARSSSRIVSGVGAPTPARIVVVIVGTILAIAKTPIVIVIAISIIIPTAVAATTAATTVQEIPVHSTDDVPRETLLVMLMTTARSPRSL